MNHQHRSHRTIQILLAFCLASIALGLTLFFPQPPLAHAATITVQSSADGSAIPGNCPGGGCRLRDAIAAANPAGGDIIDFSLTYPATITLTSGELVITKSLTINGPSAISLTISGGNTTRVINDTSGVNLNLSSVSIANGNTNNSGGGIVNIGILNITNTTFYSNSASVSGGGILNYHGTVNVTNSAFYSNSAGLDGGGIFNGDALNVTNSNFSSNNAAYSGGGIHSERIGLNITGLNIVNSTFSNNSASINGGGIFITYTATSNITGSTFSGNSASQYGGGIWNNVPLTITDSTFSGNSATFYGGGVYNTSPGMLSIANSTFSSNSSTLGGGGIMNDLTGMLIITNNTIVGNFASIFGGAGGGIYNSAGTVTMTNSTISANYASSGGGIFHVSGSSSLRNTIVANSSVGGNCTGSIANDGNNIDSGTTCGWGSSNGSKSSADPKLAPLANNGGATQTMALLPGSPAIDGVTFNAPNGCPTTDQRGAHRPIGPRCDIGAYEAGYLFLPLILK